MYSPVKDGIEKSAKFVRFTEVKPPESFHGLVHSYWELRTEAVLAEDFHYQVIPDACINILFNQKNLDIAAVTAAPASAIVLNLGKDFHYLGIQLFPGAWRGSPKDLCRELVDQPYLGTLPLVETNRRLASLSFQQQAERLTRFAAQLINIGLIANNPITSKILKNVFEIQKVSDMARLTGLSTRQLQRSLKDTTGFAPHGFFEDLAVAVFLWWRFLDPLRRSSPLYSFLPEGDGAHTGGIQKTFLCLISTILD
jgi:AraC-like DNA-binding protein